MLVVCNFSERRNMEEDLQSTVETFIFTPWEHSFVFRVVFRVVFLSIPCHLMSPEK